MKAIRINKPLYPWFLLSSTGFGVLLVMLNISSLNVALPAISAYFQAGPVETSWVLISYMLFNTIFILIFGKLADIFGRRRLYLIGLSGFSIMSFLCGLAPNVWVLIILRALQAITGALIITNTIPMITDAFPGRFLGTALGINIVVASAGQLMGPVVGGLLVHTLGWRWVFWFNVPMGLIGLVWSIIILRPVPGRAKEEKVDIWGNLFIFLSLVGVILALSEGGVIGWHTYPVIIGFALFIIFMVCFLWIERRIPFPMIDFSLFNNRAYVMANLATFLNSLARASILLVVVLYFQVVCQQNPFEAGIKGLPLTIGMILASPLAGTLCRKYSTYKLSTSGLFISCIGMVLLMVNLNVYNSPVWITMGLLLVGVGTGIFQTPNTHSIMMSVPPNRWGIANGLRSMLQNMGSVISTAFSLMVITSSLPGYLKNAIYAGANANLELNELYLITRGYKILFSFLIVLTVLAMIASFLRNTSSKISSEKV
ncbi:MFS transporter [Pelotomaculum propionicicum]|nr:MFS transporter [Pelotomaculum propionicicum]